MSNLQLDVHGETLKSAARCTGWITEIYGAPNANGRKLVQDLENQTNDSAPESSSQNNEGYKPLIIKQDH